MTNLITFLNGSLGRALRFLLGVGLIGYGVLVLGGIAGALLAVVGLAPIALALSGRCLLEPFAPRSRPIP